MLGERDRENKRRTEPAVRKRFHVRPKGNLSDRKVWSFSAGGFERELDEDSGVPGVPQPEGRKLPGPRTVPWCRRATIGEA